MAPDDSELLLREALGPSQLPFSSDMSFSAEGFVGSMLSTFCSARFMLVRSCWR